MFALGRHAHAKPKQSWGGADRNRPLTARGRQQALGVAENLGAVQPVRLLSSPTMRCRQTLDPLAIQTRLPIDSERALGPDADVAELDRLLHDGWAEDAVLCTHGEVMRDLRRRWERTGSGLTFNGDWPPGGRTEKGAAWLVDADAGVWTLHYFRPVHVGPVLGAPDPV